MEVKKRPGEKRGGVKWGGLGGGGLLVVVGGALVAATVWSLCEFRRRRNPSCKKGTLKDFLIPNLEKVKNTDDGGDGVGVSVILKNSKLLVVGSETEEKDYSASNLPSDVEKRSELGIIEEGDEEIQEGTKIEEDGSVDKYMALYQKEDVILCEAVHKKMHEGVEFCDDVMDADTLSSISEDELAVSKDDGMMLVEKMALMQFEPLESVTDDGVTRKMKRDEVAQFMSLESVNNDGSNDAVSEDLDYEVEDVSEGSSRGTSDSSTESNNEAVWPAEPLEPLSKDIKGEKMLTNIQTEIVEVEEDEGEKMSSANGIYHNDSNANDSLSIHKAGWNSMSKDQMMMVQGNSTNKRIWVSTVLVALLVLLGALIAQHKYFYPAIADDLSSINALRF